jgi:hypothetical protein
VPARPITQLYSHIVLDACTLINVCHSQRAADLLLSFSELAVVTDYVVEKEAMYLYDGPLEDALSSRIPLDLTPMQRTGILSVTTLSEDEAEIFVSLVLAMGDDGEATTGAVARQRGYAMATDDILARRVMAQFAPEVHIVSTPDLVHHWATGDNVTNAEIREVVRNIRFRSRFTAPRDHPLKNWWMLHETG